MCVCVSVCVRMFTVCLCECFFRSFRLWRCFSFAFPSLCRSIYLISHLYLFLHPWNVCRFSLCLLFFFFFGESKRQSLHTCVYATSEHAYGKFYFFYALYLLVVFSCVYAILRYCVDSLFLKTDKQRILTQQRAQTLLSLKYQFLTKQNSHLVRQSST